MLGPPLYWGGQWALAAGVGSVPASIAAACATSETSSPPNIITLTYDQGCLCVCVCLFVCLCVCVCVSIWTSSGHLYSCICLFSCFYSHICIFLYLFLCVCAWRGTHTMMHIPLYSLAHRSSVHAPPVPSSMHLTSLVDGLSLVVNTSVDISSINCDIYDTVPLGTSPVDPWKWDRSNGVGKSEMSIIWCMSKRTKRGTKRLPWWFGALI